MLLDRSLCLPATFLPCGEGGRTWEATDGSMHRIDYVAVPAAWRGRVVSATADASVDLAISRADHRCAVVELYGAFSGSREAPPRPRLLYDRRALLDPATVDKVREKLKDVPNVSWDKGVDEHAATVTDFLLGTLAECCPRASARQSKEWISPETWRLIRRRADGLAAGKRLRSGLDTVRLRAIIAGWGRWSHDLPGGPSGGMAPAAPRVLGEAIERGRRLLDICVLLEAAPVEAAPVARPPLRGRRAEALRAAIRGLRWAISRGTRLRQVEGPGARPCAEWTGAAFRTAAVLVWSHGLLGGVLRAHLWRDRRACVEEAAKEVGRAFRDSRVADGHAGLRRIRGACPGSKCRFSSSSAAVLMSDGTVAASYEAGRALWLEHFAEQELAVVLRPAELAESFHEQLAMRAPREWAEGEGGCAAPTLAELEAGFRRAHKGRAPGLDGIPDDLLAVLPCEMARVWHPLMVKMTIRVQEPLAFKGGRFAELFKGKGGPRECGLSRSIFLASGVAKQFHRLVRNRLMPNLERYSPDITCAMGGKGVDTGSHYIRLVQDWAGGKGMSSAVIFFDITAAYYTVLRELAFGGCSDESVVTLLRRLDLPPSAAHDLAAYLGECASLADAGVPEHLSAMTAEVLTNTWGMTQGCPHIAASRRGSRPGDPLADAIFGFVFGRCRRRIRDKLRSAGLVAQVPWSGANCLEAEVGPGGGCSAEISDIGYADDLALPVVAPAGDLLDMVAVACAIVLDGLLRHGWAPNMGGGKTETVIRLVGKGAVEQSQRLAHGMGYQIPGGRRHARLPAPCGPGVPPHRHPGGRERQHEGGDQRQEGGCGAGEALSPGLLPQFGCPGCLEDHAGPSGGCQHAHGERWDVAGPHRGPRADPPDGAGGVDPRRRRHEEGAAGPRGFQAHPGRGGGYWRYRARITAEVLPAYCPLRAGRGLGPPAADHAAAAWRGPPGQLGGRPQGGLVLAAGALPEAGQPPWT